MNTELTEKTRAKQKQRSTHGRADTYISSIEFMFAEISIFLARIRAKMSSEKGLKHIYAQEYKLYSYYYHFGWHRENKN